MSKSQAVDKNQSPTHLYTIFDRRQMALIVCLASFAATFSGFASNIYFPALPTVAKDLDVSTELVNLTVTAYLIFQGIAPSFWGPLSDVKGRRLGYCCTFLLFLGACTGLAFTTNYATLITLRCLQSAGSASTIAIGSGVIGDITTRENRGGLMGIFQAGLLVPVAVGPIIGGAIAESLGWRAIFMFLAIYAAVFLLALVILLPETLRSIVGNGGTLPTSYFFRYPLEIYQNTTKISWRHGTSSDNRSSKGSIDVLGPLRILVSKHAAPVIVFLAIHYAVWQMSITAMSSLFEVHYGLTELQIGLTYIANGVGSMMGTLITGKLLDIHYRKAKATHQNRRHDEAHSAGKTSDRPIDEGFPFEHARLRLVPIFSAAQSLSILVFGWTIQYPNDVPIAIPITSTFFTGWSAISTQSIIMTYLVDVFPDKSAAASASLNLARCLFAAAGTSFVMPMVRGTGVGLAFTICVAVQILGLSLLLVASRFGTRRRVE